MSDPALEVSGLATHPRRGRVVLRGVSLSLASDDVVAVVGESGAGKTTLLRVLAGLEAFASGSIRLGDVVVHAGDRRSPLVGRVGMVFQGFELFPNLSAIENCSLALRVVRGFGADDARRRAEQTLAELGLESHLDAHPGELSGGERQRVAIARALVVEPALLLYDEPTSALDQERKADVRRIIAGVRERAIPQIVVTHDLAPLHEVCSGFFELEGGVLRRKSAEPAAFESRSAPSGES